MPVKNKFALLSALLISSLPTLSPAWILGKGLGGTITVVTSPSWGLVCPPSSGSVSYALNPTTGLVTILSGIGQILGGASAGAYLLTGTSNESISYSVSIGPFTGSGISVTSAYINGLSSGGSGTLDILGAKTLTVGGVLSIASNATPGLQTATVTVTVNFL